MVESDSILKKGLIDSLCRVVYLSPDSVFEIAAFRRIRNLAWPFYQDCGGRVRDALGLTGLSPVEIVIDGGRVVYVNVPERNDIEGTRGFLRRLKRLSGQSI